jgi:imidazolonepropionase-like amidohydrolase
MRRWRQQFHSWILQQALGLTLIACANDSAHAADLAAPGFRPGAPGVHALVGARIFLKPGTLLERGTIVLRDGWITEVGPDVRPPSDARVWDATGHTIYPGFFDPYLALPTATGARPEGMSPDSSGSGASKEIPESGAAVAASGGYRFFGVSGQERDPGGAGPGYANADVTPEHRMAARYTPDAKLIDGMRELGFTGAQVVPSKGVIRGQSAVVVFGDGGPNESILRAQSAQHVAFAVSGGDNAFPNSLMGTIALVRQSFLDARDYANQNASSTSGVPKPLPRYNAALEALQAPLLGNPRQTVVFDPESPLMVERVGAVAREMGLIFQVLASGQEWRRPEIAKATAASFIVPIAFPAPPKFPDDASWESISLDQLRSWDWAAENPAVLRQNGVEIALTTHALGDRKEFRKNLRAALDRGLSETDALAALTLVPARLCGVEAQLGSIETGKLANLTVCDSKGYFDPEGVVRSVWVQGRLFEIAGGSTEKTNVASGPKSTNTTDTAEAKAEKEKAETKKKEARERTKKRVARAPWAGRGPSATPPAVLIQNAVIWTSAEAGILTNASLLVVNGTIRSVGTVPTGALPDGTLVLDMPGIHISPGILDCHSHSMILGGVNEGTLPSSAMVRIGDVVNSEAETIHQQLAGGLTVANLLHGSANPIGGQNCVIKLREGLGPEGLKFLNAPPGIKFALGENVKQANWGDSFRTRFPQSRMGVPTFYKNRFTAAQQYAAAQQRATAGGPPVRQDLELDALVEILQGKRLIHCHSYRQDEILAFLRTMESFGVRVATLQHILEGYKVADEIAKHGAGASAFADWWGYKFEVVDAIPYAGAIMHERGVQVSINSDSSDHARRLNLEAAKAVKYGAVSQVEALKFVTINPAKQLQIDRWVGSLEPGKDADFVLWSGSPLDTSSVCLQTWIEGRKYFDRTLEADRARALAEERTTLIAKAKAIAGGSGGATASDKAREAFFRQTWEQASHLGVHQCLDCQYPQRR